MHNLRDMFKEFTLLKLRHTVYDFVA